MFALMEVAEVAYAGLIFEKCCVLGGLLNANRLLIKFLKD